MHGHTSTPLSSDPQYRHKSPRVGGGLLYNVRLYNACITLVPVGGDSWLQWIDGAS